LHHVEKGFFSFSIKEQMTKWLNPDAVVADTGESMQAYYDDKRKIWVFPGEDPEEKSKPLGPPPISQMTPMQSNAQESTGAASSKVTQHDPLAAMMAPPPRVPSSMNRHRHPNEPSPFSPSTITSIPGPSTPLRAPPQFSVFQPSPNVSDRK
jgi:hypothetical protein